MSSSAIRYPNHHRPVPIRKGVAWHGKYHVSSAPLQRKVAEIRFVTACLSQMNDVIAKPAGLIFISNGGAIIQFPIGLCPL